MALTEGKTHIRKKNSNKKRSTPKVDIALQLTGKQASLPKSSSSKDLKRSLGINSSGGTKGNRNKPTFEMYSSVPSGLTFDRAANHQQPQQVSMQMAHALSPKINARKVQARRTTDPTVEQSNELRKKLQLNLSQTRSQLQRLVEQRHLTRAYQLETRKYDTLAQSINLG